MATPIKVLLVDDSAVVRGLMQRAFNNEANIKVIATAIDGNMALDVIKRTEVDVVVLDIEMPGMDGLTALPLLLQAQPKLKIIMASTLTMRNAEISLNALALGASDYIAKPTAKSPNEVEIFYRQLIDKICALGGVRSMPAEPVKSPVIDKPKLTGFTAAVPPGAAPLVKSLIQPLPAAAIAIASSTGGPQALLEIFKTLRGRKLQGPIFITQHMPPTFTTILAQHISKAVGADCHEGADGELVRAGVIYIAPGDFHMTVERQGSGMVIRLNQNEQENFCRPSADPMLRSLAKLYGTKLLTIVLTGLGSDGARGALEVVQNGGYVIAQDEASCVVYGMPRAVVDAKLASAVLPLSTMGTFIAGAIT